LHVRRDRARRFRGLDVIRAARDVERELLAQLLFGDDVGIVAIEDDVDPPALIDLRTGLTSSASGSNDERRSPAVTRTPG
jgi:hypothetical protein